MQMRILISIIVFSVSIFAKADVLVIVNANNSIDHLDYKQVVDLFMGRVTAFPNEKPAQTLEVRSGNSRAVFYKALTGKSEAQVDAYWATLVFAGRMTPPKQYPNDQAIISAVSENLSAIAYVPKQPLPATVKVVLELSTE